MTPLEVMSMIPREPMLQSVHHVNETEWLNDRAKGIGSSDVASILGLSPWQTRTRTWRRKVGLDPDTEQNPSMAEGHMMEPQIAKEYAEDTGAEVVTVPFLRDREHPWRVASLDRIAVYADGELRIVECKWSARGFDGIPSYYLTQCLWQMALTGIHACDLAVRRPGKRTEIRAVEWDADLAEQIVAAVDAFWTDYVAVNIEPEPTTPEERTDKALARLMGRELTEKVEPSDIMLMAEGRLAEYDRIIKAAEYEAKAMKAKAAELMGEAGVKSIKFPNGSTWTYVEKPGSVSWQKYALDLGGTKEGAKKYAGEPSRYVLVKHAEEE